MAPGETMVTPHTEQGSAGSARQHEAVVTGELAGMVAGPQAQVIRLGDDDQFFVLLKVRHIFLAQSVQMVNSLFIFDRLRR
jgi:hypothetical protein